MREKISAILALLLNGSMGPVEATDKIVELNNFSELSSAQVCPECEGTNIETQSGVVLDGAMGFCIDCESVFNVYRKHNDYNDH